MPADADNGFELSITRYIAARPERVWDIMVNRITEWWCPRPWRTEIIEQDWRAGGRCALMMYGPDGETSGGDGIFLEVTPGRRFVSTDSVVRRDGKLLPGTPFMIGGWEIEPEGTGTRYRAWARHWDQDAMESHRKMGFEEGWSAVADQLAELAEADT